MKKLEKRHLENFRAECAANQLPCPNETSFCQQAIMKPSVELLGEFFGDNLRVAGDVVSLVAESIAYKHAVCTAGFWFITPADDESNERFATWYLDFISLTGGAVSIATFALPEGVRSDVFKGWWTINGC